MTNLKWTGERVIPKEMQIGDNPLHQSHLARILCEHLARYNWASKFCKDKTVFDAACGSGYGTAILKENAKFAHGADISEDAIKYAIENYERKDMLFAVCDFSKLWIPPTCAFDIIVSFETIEHMKDPKIFLKNVERFFEDKFIFSIPLNNVGEFHEKEYTLQEAKDMIASIFAKEKNVINYFTQDKEKITEGTDENSRFILGIVTKY